MNPRLIWALFYVVMNGAALIYGLATGELMGDGATFMVRDIPLFITCFALLGLSIFFLYGFYHGISRVSLPISTMRLNEKALSYLFLSYIVFFIGFVYATGLFIAGSAERGGNAVSALFVLFNVDLFFFLYYACCRQSPRYFPVTCVWLVSVIQRGWFGYVFILIALESFKLIRAGRIKPSWVIAGAILVVAYPFVEAFKVLIRLNPDINIVKILSMVPDMQASSAIDLGETLQFVFEKVVGRVQVLAHSYLIMDNHRYFEIAMEHGENVPFWKEGIAGVMLDRMFGVNRLSESSALLAVFIVPGNQSAWNVNPSVVGWLSIYSGSLPQAIVYILLLAAASYALMKKLSDTIHSRDVLWFYWLVFLIPGWISQFSSLIIAMILFIFLNMMLNFMVKVSAAAIGNRPFYN
jgi:hypothetical protein